VGQMGMDSGNVDSPTPVLPGEVVIRTPEQ